MAFLRILLRAYVLCDFQCLASRTTLYRPDPTQTCSFCSKSVRCTFFLPAALCSPWKWSLLSCSYRVASSSADTTLSKSRLVSSDTSTSCPAAMISAVLRTSVSRAISPKKSPGMSSVSMVWLDCDTTTHLPFNTTKVELPVSPAVTSFSPSPHRRLRASALSSRIRLSVSSRIRGIERRLVYVRRLFAATASVGRRSWGRALVSNTQHVAGASTTWALALRLCPLSAPSPKLWPGKRG
mmetsp:Transcript_45152/g.97748  ORF Transcript_45152/g.97748 Transcript_45152/m.97748 type:complete len:239 (+) Transcript_45152:112-828(+)